MAAVDYFPIPDVHGAVVGEVAEGGWLGAREEGLADDVAVIGGDLVARVAAQRPDCEHRWAAIGSASLF